MLTVNTPPEFTIYEVKVNSLKIYAGSLKINYPTILALSIRLWPVKLHIIMA